MRAHYDYIGSVSRFSSVTPARLFLSSGDLTADRRYDYGNALQSRGDVAAAADLFAQAIDLAPHFASAWFALGECRERLNQHDDAIVAYRTAIASDPQDRHGAALRLMRLGATAVADMPAAYVTALFDQYAPRFEQSLTGELSYRGPQLLLTAVVAVRAAQGKPAAFRHGIDLGCGTGLAGRAFAGMVDTLDGVDLAPAMIARARATECYAALEVADMVAALRAHADDSLDLVLAADATVYLADLGPLVRGAARVLKHNGLLAFTVETHGGEGVTLGAGLRYAHAEPYVRASLRDAGLSLAHLNHSSARNEDCMPAPGLVVVASRSA